MYISNIKQKNNFKISNKTEAPAGAPHASKIKTFILDTNIPIQDPTCLTRFQEHNVAIPIPLIEELDKVKKGNGTKSINAREFTRNLGKFTKNYNPETNPNIPLGAGLGDLSILPGVSIPEQISRCFQDDTQDHRILAIALDQKKQGNHVVLVTNDLNLEIKAKTLGIEAESYRNDSVRDMGVIYNSLSKETPTEEEWDAMSTGSTKASFSSLERFSDLPLNHQFILNQNILVRKTANGLEKIRPNHPVFGIKAKNPEQEFALDALLSPEISLVALTGKAGTGKTLLALAAALEQKKDFDEIIVARPAIELSDKTLGFLPGDMNEKIDPYMQPIYDNLEVIREANQKHKGGDESIREWAKKQNIHVLVLNFIRGRSLPNRLIIIDEAQNTTPGEMKTILTRGGEGTKFVIIGDITQIDSPYQNEQSNGLSYLVDRWTGQPEFVHVHLTRGERSSLAEKAAQLM